MIGSMLSNNQSKPMQGSNSNMNKKSKIKTNVSFPKTDTTYKEMKSQYAGIDCNSRLTTLKSPSNVMVNNNNILE